MKKALPMALAAILVLSLVPSALADGNTFSDVAPTHWAYNYIEQAAAAGAVNGVGNGKFDPEGTVTWAQFATIVVRAYYPDEVDSSVGGDWYTPYQQVANNHSLLIHPERYDGKMNDPINREDMAFVVRNIMYQQGYTVDTSAMDAAKAKIKDWSAISGTHQQPVLMAYAAGIINGMGDGSFSPRTTMTRAQCATVYCRLVATVPSGGSPVPQTYPTTPTTPTQPTTPTTPSNTGTYGPVGTISDGDVTLSYATHAPVVDYWSQQSAEIRAISDKDAFNAFVATLRDQETIADLYAAEGNAMRYNFAVFQVDGTQAQNNVIRSARAAVNCLSLGYGQTEDGLGYFMPGSRDYMAIVYTRYPELYAQIDNCSSQMEKAVVCCNFIVSHYSYGNGVFDVTRNSMGIGLCGSFAAATQTVMSTAGIPCMHVAGGNHGWNIARIDGVWYVVDTSVAARYNDPGDTAICNFAGWVSGHPGSKANACTADTVKVAMAMVEAAGW